MQTHYLADSIRVANYQAREPSDIGRFRPRVLEFTPMVSECDEGYFGHLPRGSRTANYATPAEAEAAILTALTGRGWTPDKTQAEADAIKHAHRRKNAHPNR